ncbi:transcription factor IIA, alpha/beta subunit [Parasitella parasitica]|nr:transcription factor IIA, alpha/beta subunit [Parasitella parasitica]
MSNAIVSNVYRYVIDDVINQVRGDFEDMGIDDSILQELQRSWETKVARSRVANFGFKEDNYYEDDGNSHGDGNVLSSNHVNNNVNGQKQNQLSYPSDYSNNNTNPHNNNGPSAASLASLAATTAAARPPLPQPYGLPPNINNNNNASRPFPDPSQLVNQYQMMQQHKPPHMQQLAQQHQQQQSNTLPELQLPGLPRPNLPQNDGAGDEFESLTTKQIDRHIEDMIQSSQVQAPENEEMQISFTASSFSGEPLALESLPDSVKQLMKEARERAIKAGAIKKHSRIAQLDGEGDTPAATPSSAGDATVTTATTTAAATSATTANDDDINSDLDDSDDDDDDGEGGEEIEHIILCLYDKVTRTKNKWKCILKDGIMLVNGRDYLFHRANGDFEW